VRIALFSDIHGNALGLREVLADIEARGGADVLFALGDILGGSYGTDEVIDLLLEHQVALIHGNHEELHRDPQVWIETVSEPWRDWARREADWMQKHLSAEYWDLLAALPLSQTIEMTSDQRLFVCHAAPQDPWARMCAADAPRDLLRAAFGGLKAEVVAYGHFHSHHVLWLDGQPLINVASVGLRRDGLSAYTLLESEEHSLAVQQFQIPYDSAEEARLNQLRAVPRS
jgi:predicted phosphodiesterase